MSYVSIKSRRNFTPAARAAALARRRENAANKPPPEPIKVYVTRMGTGFGWEIRRFGALALARSETSYATAALAHLAGENALGEVANTPANEMA